MLGLSLALAVLASGCGSGGDRDRITVLAAASLTSAFTEIGHAFEEANPGIDVLLSFGPSSALALQVREGVPADVLATADEQAMESVGEEVGRAQTFARNRPAIIVPPGNPGRVNSLRDLARPDLAVVLCARQVPCGRVAAEALAAAGVDVVPRSYEADVRAVVTRVVLGEADAGIAYRSDVVASGERAEGVDLRDPAATAITNAYPIAVLARSRARAGAERFAEFVLSAPGQEILARLGFEGP